MIHSPGTGQTPPPHDLDHIRSWVFDLDNTLYPAHCNLFAQVDQRIGEFISRFLEIDLDAARSLQKRFFREHGTTLRGLMTVYGMAPGAFLDYVHDIDLSPVPSGDRLAIALARLPGRKYIFTNASENHAERVMARLGVADMFDGVFDIAAADYVPKPDPRPYRQLIDRYGIDPQAGAMVEDIARNLSPAAALGMTTVWVPGKEDWSVAESGNGDIHHVTSNLPDWLEQVPDRPSG